MFPDELERIDRALSIDSPLGKHTRTKRGDARDPHKADRLARNPNAGQQNSMAVLNDLTGRPWWDRKGKLTDVHG